MISKFSAESVMTPTCPKCRNVIPSEDINVAADVAYCRSCNLSHKLSVLTHGLGVEANVDVLNPPPGAWHRADGVALVIGATNRSLGSALGTLLIALFWNGIVSIFLLLVIAATLQHLGFTLPHWFPAPIMNDSPMSVGMTLFLWIFLTPFIAIGSVMIGAFLMCLGGRTEIRIQGGEGAVFNGIGPLGIKRRFETSAVKDIRIDENKWRDSEGGRNSKTNIIIETATGKKIKFGSMLTDERRTFLAGALQKSLMK